MKTHLRHASTRLLVAMTLASSGLVTAASAQTVRYAIQDLGPVDSKQSIASSINDDGVAVGWVQTNNPNNHDTHAARTVAGGMLEFLPGLEWVGSGAEGINTFGDIVGYVTVSAFPNYANHAMRYTQARGIEDLGTLGGVSSFAYHINRSGQVSGWSYVGSITRAFIATPGRPLQDLGTFSGTASSSSFAGGINDSGQVAGHAETSNGRWHAFRYMPGVGLQELGTPIGTDSFAADINAGGQVVGDSGGHAFRYTNGVGMQDLHRPSLGLTSKGFSLNERGDVVGYIYTSGSPSRAFVYTDAGGMVDLNSSIDAASGWVLNMALGINSAGEIVGQGTYLGGFQWRAFKLTPLPPDTTAPVVTVPANITEEAGSPGGVTVMFGASASDAGDGPTPAVCTPDSGSTFPVGTTTVTCTSTDTSGNQGSGSFTITVVDRTPPAVTVPADISNEAAASNGVAVSFSASATDLVDGPTPVLCAPASGSTFPLGTTAVTCQATDAHANPGSASFNVTVRDTIAPVIALPANISTSATSFAGARVTFTTSAGDLVDGVRPVVCTPASGSTFAIGATMVNCLSADTRGNSAARTFTVTVTFDFLQARSLLATLINAVRTGNTAAACSQLTGVIPVIQAQVGSRLTQAEATALIRMATDAKRALHCP